MSEITQPPPDVPTQDSNSRVNRLNAASDQNTPNNQTAEQQSGKQAAEAEQEKQVSQHDPAVTLASTLSKLDAGSHFQATVSGQDGDGRTIIQSDLGTYLVHVERSHVEEFKKLQQEEQLDLRVITIDKEIKAEINRQVETEEGKTQLTTIPVSLTLTDLGQAQTQVPPSASPVTPQQPLEDIRSQYNATTLYRAERIAREIGEKLDNLPLPTSAPNYTVFGSAPPPTDQPVDTTPKQVSSNVFIQEVSTSANQAVAAGQIAQQTLAINNLLGRDISVEVIKTVPQTTIPLPDSLPAAVRNEITAATPLDNVTKGQTLNINVAAVAVPEAKVTAITAAQTIATSSQTAVNTSDVQTPTANITTAGPVVTAAPPVENNAAANLPAQNTALGVVSGIIVDAQQSSAINPTNPVAAANPIAAASYAQQPSAAAKTGKTVSQAAVNNTYYLATPSSVLKFTSDTPLVAGTIVSFTVSPQLAPEATGQPTPNPAQSLNPAVSSTNTSVTSTNPAATATAENTTTQSPTSPTPLNSIAPTLADRIDQFFPQELDQLTEEWGSISLAMSALASTASTSMAAIMASRIPNMQSPEQLSSTMFFFLSALKSATPARTWMGPDVSARLKKIGAARTIDRIDHDFSRIARVGAEVAAGEWRPLLIPAQSGQDYMAIPMIIKHIGGEEKEGAGQHEQADPENDKNATRFILEINFSELGHVLIDGLLKKNRLDIILKSNELIPHAVKSKLSRKFTDAIENSNFDGELVIIDSAPAEISVRKMIEQLTHNAKLEKKI